MFSDMVTDLNRSIMPEPVSLAKRFDIAITKKLGVVQLPPAFWMKDPKINPRSDHLLWAALLVLDRKRIELAMSVIAVEISEASHTANSENQDLAAQRGRDLIDQLLHQIHEPGTRKEFELKLRMVLPDWLAEAKKNSQ